MRRVDVLEFGGPPPRPGRRRWRIVALAGAAVLLAGGLARAALADHSGAGPAARPSAPAFVPDPLLARAAGAALPGYPGAVPPVGYLDAGRRTVGEYGADPGRPVQLDAACAGTGSVLVDAWPAGPQPTGPALASATVPCTGAPTAVTLTLKTPPDGRYRLVLTAAPAAGVLAWRLIPW